MTAPPSQLEGTFGPWLFNSRSKWNRENSKFASITHNANRQTLWQTIHAIHKSIIGAFQLTCQREGKNNIAGCQSICSREWTMLRGECVFWCVSVQIDGDDEFESWMHAQQKLIQSLKFKMYLWANLTYDFYRKLSSELKHTNDAATAKFKLQSPGDFFNSKTLSNDTEYVLHFFVFIEDWIRTFADWFMDIMTGRRY